MKSVIPSLLLFLLTSAPLSAATILFDLQGKGGAGLLSTNENSTVTGSPGTGGEIGAGISYDDFTNILSINVGWGSGNGFINLTGAATASHIHGPTPSAGAGSFLENAGVIPSIGTLTRNNSTANAGFISTTVTLSESQETELLAGRYYINIHTTTNASGEIRGNLVAVPEPSRSLLVAAGGLMIALRRRRA